MKKYLVYKLTNMITQKSYIGKTNNLPARLNKHKTDRHCVYLNNSIRKHGFENFHVEVLHECENENEAFRLETAAIRDLHTLSPSGYNLLETDGPERRLGPESLKKLSRSLQGRIVANKKSSAFKGVLKPKDYNLYVTKMRNQRQRYVRVFKNEIDAAEAYDKLALFIHGSNAKMNFPEKLQKYLSEDLALFVSGFRINKV